MKTVSFLFKDRNWSLYIIDMNVSTQTTNDSLSTLFFIHSGRCVSRPIPLAR